VGHEPSVHPNKGYATLKKKRSNKYSNLGLNHRISNRNVCKAFQPFRNITETTFVDHLIHLHEPLAVHGPQVKNPWRRRCGPQTALLTS